MVLEKSEFIEWLRSLSKDRVFGDYDCSTCPVAKWLHSKGFPSAGVYAHGYYRLGGEYEYEKSPSWVSDFVNWIDSNRGISVEVILNHLLTKEGS